MTRIEANTLLEEHKLGIRIHPVVEITKALWVTGDLKGIPRHAKPLSPNGINEWMESSCMAQSQGIGQSSNRDLARHQQGFDQQNEGNK